MMGQSRNCPIQMLGYHGYCSLCSLLTGYLNWPLHMMWTGTLVCSYSFHCAPTEVPFV